jgi:hypothetical protein
MQAVTIYQASDGQRFDSEQKCREYEALVGIIVGVMSTLRPASGLQSGEFVQQDRAQCLTVKRRLVEVARTMYDPKSYPVFAHDADEIHPMSGAGRILTDGAPECLSRAWCRLMRINWDSYREYDQPFFAMNPDKAEEAVESRKRYYASRA